MSDESNLSPEFKALYRELVTIRLTLQSVSMLMIRMVFVIAVLLLLVFGLLGYHVTR